MMSGVRWEGLAGAVCDTFCLEVLTVFIFTLWLGLYIMLLRGLFGGHVLSRQLVPHGLEGTIN